MSDPLAEGSIAKPYRENPPTHFQEVHWGGSIAVKWNFSQFLHLEGALPVPNSTTGTMSVWLKFHPDLASYGQGLASLFYSAWMDLSVTTRDDWSTVVHGGAAWGMTDFVRAYHRFKFFPASADAFFNPGSPNTYAYLVDTGNAFEANARWYHVFAQWDMGPGALTLTVNGRSLSTVVYPGSYVDPGDAGPPFPVPWGYPVANDSTPNSTQFFSNTNLDDAVPVGFSIAEYWLEVHKPPEPEVVPVPPPGVDKFVDRATGQPKPLGKDGELPTGAKPAFYFARSGSPQTFVRNRGYGGAFVFARGHYGADLSFTFEDLIGPAIDHDPPLDEPDRPHYTPTAPPPHLE